MKGSALVLNSLTEQTERLEMLVSALSKRSVGYCGLTVRKRVIQKVGVYAATYTGVSGTSASARELHRVKPGPYQLAYSSERTVDHRDANSTLTVNSDLLVNRRSTCAEAGLFLPKYFGLRPTDELFFVNISVYVGIRTRERITCIDCAKWAAVNPIG